MIVVDSSFAFRGVLRQAVEAVMAPIRSDGDAFRMLSRTLGFLARQVLNHLLEPNQRAKNQLKSVAGKTVCIEVAPVQMIFQITSAGLLNVVSPQPDVVDQADTHITMQRSDLFGLLASPSSVSRKARIEGDVEVAQVFSSALQNLSWDSERDLARMIGDVPAVWVMKGLRRTGTTFQDLFQRFKYNLREYAVYEQAMTPSMDQVDVFRRQLNDLRDEIARLEKRVQTLSAKSISQ